MGRGATRSTLAFLLLVAGGCDEPPRAIADGCFNGFGCPPCAGTADCSEGRLCLPIGEPPILRCQPTLERPCEGSDDCGAGQDCIEERCAWLPGAGGAGGEGGQGGDGGAGGEECRGPLEDYCSRCPTYEAAFAKAFDGFEICSGDGPTNTLPAAGTCGEFRWIVTWDVVDEYFEYFDASGTLVGATFVTDVFVLCGGSSAVKRYGLVPDCERVTTARACEPP